jgi:hypothetical protein
MFLFNGLGKQALPEAVEQNPDSLRYDAGTLWERSG